MKYPDDFINKIICGDCLSIMKKIPAKSIDMVITSPPYWGLRDYGNEQIFGGDKDCKHEWGSSQVEHDALRYRGRNASVGSNKNPEIHPGKEGSGGNYCQKCQAWKGQLGLEPTPEMYIKHLTEIFNEVKRVLKKEGTLWLNIGDTYWSAKGSCFNPGGGEKSIETKRREIYPLHRGNKSDVPNLPQKSLTMIPERLAWSFIQNGWILRNKIIWIKPNCMPSSVKDRYVNKWEYVFYFVKSQRNYFNLDAVRELVNYPNRKYNPDTTKHSYRALKEQGNRTSGGLHDGRTEYNHPKGKNPGDIWIINTVPCPVKGIHFATFPEELCRKAIIPGCPEGGIVLDPFCGVGTACYVAQRLGRKFIGVDIKAEYCEKAENIRLAQGVL